MACDPHKPTAYAMLALALVEQSRLDEAAQAAEEARRRARLDSGILNLGASIALKRSRPAEARVLTERALEVDPHDQRALSDLILIHRQLGEDPPAHALTGAPGVVALTAADPPRGFADIVAFNAALEAAILAHPELQAPRGEAAMVGGRRLADVFKLPPQLTEGLRAIIDAALGAYESRLNLGADHPVITGRPQARRIVGWANVVGPGDHERAHIHEAGWVSGVYYVRMPPLGGAIELGGHHLAGLPFSEPEQIVQPEAGGLLLFPSYLHHRTRPYDGAGARISIAFDVLRD